MDEHRSEREKSRVLLKSGVNAGWCLAILFLREFQLKSGEDLFSRKLTPCNSIRAVQAYFSRQRCRKTRVSARRYRLENARKFRREKKKKKKKELEDNM